MKKFAFLFLSLLFFISSGYSQNYSSDSLKILLKTATSNNRIDILNCLSWQIKYENTSDAFKFAQEAIRSANKLNYLKGKAEASKCLAALNLLTNKTEEALKYAEQGISYSITIHDDYTLAKLFNLKALILEDKCAYSQAITFFDKSYQLFNKLGDRTETTGILNNLAVLYGQINENSLSLKTYLQVIDIEQKANNKSGLARTYNNLAGVYNSMGDYNKAISFFRKGLLFSRQVASIRFETAALNGIGLILRERGKYDSAIVYLEQAAKLNSQNGYAQWLANNYLNLGSIYLLDLSNALKGKKYIYDATSIYHSIQDWNNYITSLNLLLEWYLKEEDMKNAHEVIDLSDKYAKDLSSIKVKRDFFLLKYKYHKNIGNLTQALVFLELSKSLEDSIEIAQQLQQSYEIQAKYDLSAQQQENEKLRNQTNNKEKTIYQQRLIIAAAIITSFLLILILIVLFRAKRKIKSANDALNEISKQVLEKASILQMSNESKDKFLSIISHDLKNPISAITGLSDLLLDNSMELSEEEKLKYIKYINEGCLSADQLLENLMKWVRSQTGKMEMKPLKFDLAVPVKNAIDLVQNSALRKEISISSSVSENTMVFADHEMISTCLINLLSNAVKFTPLQGKIIVSPTINGKSVSIDVSDTGVGISQENMQKLFKPDIKSGTLGTANEKGTGLGLLLVKEFIEKNQGNIRVQSTIGKGSTFTITIPVEKTDQNNN